MSCKCCLFVFLCTSFTRMNSEPLVAITTYEVENSGLGNSTFRLKTSDGAEREETVQVLDENSDNKKLSLHGSYSYKSPEGLYVKVEYIADEKGYRPNVTITRDKPVDLYNLRSLVATSVISTLQGGGLG